jgi:hypothetical protein
MLHLAPIVALTLAAAASCYKGKDDVPHISGSTSGAGGQGGSGATTSSGDTTTSGGNTTSSTSTGVVDPCANTIFCDDFEGYNTGAPPAGMWDNNAYQGSVAVDTGRAHSGKNAVKISADAVPDYRSVMISVADPSILPVSGNVVYGRMMFYLESAPEGTVHWTFIAGSGPIPNMGYSAIYRYGGQIPITNNGTFVGSELMANYETPDSYQSPPVGPGSDCWLHGNQTVVPVGAWTCAEWEFDGPNNSMRFWLDGTEVKALAMMGTGQGCVNQPADFPWTAPSFESMAVGWESYQMDDARVIWIDDFALGTQRIGCPK